MASRPSKYESTDTSDPDFPYRQFHLGEYVDVLRTNRPHARGQVTAIGSVAGERYYTIVCGGHTYYRHRTGILRIKGVNTYEYRVENPKYEILYGGNS